MPMSNHLILVSSVLISYYFSGFLGCPSSEVSTFSQNCFFIILILLVSAGFKVSAILVLAILALSESLPWDSFSGARLQVLQFQVLSKAIDPDDSQHLEIHRLQFPSGMEHLL